MITRTRRSASIFRQHRKILLSTTLATGFRMLVSAPRSNNLNVDIMCKRRCAGHALRKIVQAPLSMHATVLKDAHSHIGLTCAFFAACLPLLVLGLRLF